MLSEWRGPESKPLLKSAMIMNKDSKFPQIELKAATNKYKEQLISSNSDHIHQRETAH